MESTTSVSIQLRRNGVNNRPPLSRRQKTLFHMIIVLAAVHQDSALLVTLIKNPGIAVSQVLEPGTSVTLSELDLRDTPRPQRHPIVFSAFDQLEEGESFVLINDHDPQPLKRHMERMREGQVDWQYMDRGPASFRIRITRVAPQAR